MSLDERSLSARHRRDIFWLFASQLSARLGRKIDGKKDFLTCEDFPYEMVEMEFEDGSIMRLDYAIIVEGDEYYGVFTEHAGYHCIPRASIVEAKIFEAVIALPNSRKRPKKPRFLKKKEAER